MGNILRKKKSTLDSELPDSFEPTIQFNKQASLLCLYLANEKKMYVGNMFHFIKFYI